MASESGQNFTPIYTRKIEELTMKTLSPRDKRTPLVCLMHTLRETPELSPELSVDSAGVLGSMALLVNRRGRLFTGPRTSSRRRVKREGGEGGLPRQRECHHFALNLSWVNCWNIVVMMKCPCLYKKLIPDSSVF